MQSRHEQYPPSVLPFFLSPLLRFSFFLFSHTWTRHAIVRWTSAADCAIAHGSLSRAEFRSANRESFRNVTVSLERSCAHARISTGTTCKSLVLPETGNEFHLESPTGELGEPDGRCAGTLSAMRESQRQYRNACHSLVRVFLRDGALSRRRSTPFDNASRDNIIRPRRLMQARESARGFARYRFARENRAGRLTINRIILGRNIELLPYSATFSEIMDGVVSLSFASRVNMHAACICIRSLRGMDA